MVVNPCDGEPLAVDPQWWSTPVVVDPSDPCVGGPPVVVVDPCGGGLQWWWTPVVVDPWWRTPCGGSAHMPT